MTIIVGSYSIRDNSFSCLSPAMMKLHTSCNLQLSSFFIVSALSNSKYLSIWLASRKPFRLVPFVQQLSLLALIYYATRDFLFWPKPPPGLPTRAFGTRPLRLYAVLSRDFNPASQNCYLFKSSETFCDPSFRPCFPLGLILEFLASILETEFLIPLLVNNFTRLERLYSRGHYLCNHPDLGSVLHRVWQELGAGLHVVYILHDGHRLCQGQVWTESRNICINPL